MTRLLVLALSLIISTIVEAYGQDSTLNALLRNNEYALINTQSHFAGVGWNRLREDVLRSQFVLLGEDHGTSQIPIFAAALAEEFHPFALIAEIDKYQAQDLTELAEESSLPVSFAKQYPMSLAFYSWAEEFELIRKLRQQHTLIVGIDQVGLFTTGRVYARLAEQVKKSIAKKYFTINSRRLQNHDTSVMGNHLNQLTINKISHSSLDSLVTLTAGEDLNVQEIIQNYSESARIYQARDYQARINLMQSNLRDYLNKFKDQGAPKLLFKFGAYHIGRGGSFLEGLLDIGNTVQNIANNQKVKSIHILIAGRAGTKINGFDPIDFRNNVVQYYNSNERLIKMFPEPSSGNAWQVFDLRPIRQQVLNGILKISNHDAINIINNYDYAVIIPYTTASRNF